jgi:uncharacterized protein (DUF433 family)
VAPRLRRADAEGERGCAARQFHEDALSLAWAAAVTESHELRWHHHDLAGEASGNPCIRGLRITVYDVLENLTGGMTHEEILREFPYLTEEDIRACLAFAADRERKLEMLKVGTSF